jgi:hypothetical protein
MENLKWLKRKYPDSFEELKDCFDRLELDNFKKAKLKIGRLTKDVIHCQNYKKGTLIQFRRSNPVNNYNYPHVYCVVKCQLGFTESGYHSFNILTKDFVEIKS